MAADSSKTDVSARLAAIPYSEKNFETFQADRMLGDVARNLKRDGYRVGGVIRSDLPQVGGHRCDMALEELTTGKTVSIFQQLGSGSKGCRLDTSALEHVVGLVDASLDQTLDILIVNKFGKREADGRGFSATIARAVVASVPVLITLNQDYAGAWKKFCGEEGEILKADHQSIVQWLAESLTRKIPERL